MLHDRHFFRFTHSISWHYALSFFARFRLRIDAPFFLASADELAPQARSESSFRVGRPLLSRSGPLLAPMRARKDPRLGLSPLFTGRLRVPPVSFLYDALPRAFRPPFGFWPSLRCQAGVLATPYTSACRFFLRALWPSDTGQCAVHISIICLALEPLFARLCHQAFFDFLRHRTIPLR